MVESAKKRHFDAESRVLLFFSLTPIVYVLLLLSFMPERVPMHMDMWGNITRWWNRGNMLLLGLIFSALISLAIRSIKRGRSVGSNGYSAFYTVVLLFVYGQFLLLLLRAMYVFPDATSSSIVEWDPSKSFVAFFIPLYILCGLFIHKVKPNWVLGIRNRWTLQSEEVWNYTHSKARLPFLIASGLCYLILAIPPIPAGSRLVASCLVTVLLVLYLFYESYAAYQRFSCSSPHGS